MFLRGASPEPLTLTEPGPTSTSVVCHQERDRLILNKQSNKLLESLDLLKPLTLHIFLKKSPFFHFEKTLVNKMKNILFIKVKYNF